MVHQKMQLSIVKYSFALSTRYYPSNFVNLPTRTNRVEHFVL